MTQATARYAWSGVLLLIGFALGFAMKSSTPAEEAHPAASDPPPRPRSEDAHGKGRWLLGTEAEKFERVERQLRGFDATMMEVGYRFTELYFAGQDRNWDYAKYQAEKIERTIKLGLERRPKRAESAGRFLEEDLPIVLRAIQAKEKEGFGKAMERLRMGCMRCHVSEQVPYFTVYPPERRISPVRNAPPAE
ncbi:MAG: hypothetical protein M5U26_25695 [Planctomycetota bacterium]|nr:hypothetical protein [Planctomycetota bacterium]